MAAKSIVLSVGDYPNATDYVVLTDGANFICPPDTGFDAPPPSVHRYHSRTKGTLLSTEDFRMINLTLQAFGGDGVGTADVLLSNIGKLEKKGRQARLASGVNARGTSVSLAVRINGASNYTYFDVQDVRVVPGTKLQGPVNTQEVKVELTCAPWGRGPVRTDQFSGTINNGAPGYIFRAGIMGDTDAIGQLVVNDVSTAGLFINRMHVGRMSGDTMLIGDFTPVQQIVPSGSGSAHPDATALFGTAARGTCGTQFALWGSATMPAGAQQAGSFHAYLVCKDNGAFANPPTAVNAVQTNPVGGTITPGTFNVWLSSSDALGYESVAVNAGAVPVNALNNAIVATFTPGLNAVLTHIYVQSGTTWHHFIAGAASTSFTVLSVPWQAANVFTAPTINSVTPAAGGTAFPAGTYTVYVATNFQGNQVSPPSAGTNVTVTLNQQITVQFTGTLNYVVDIWVKNASNQYFHTSVTQSVSPMNAVIGAWSNNSSGPVNLPTAPTALSSSATLIANGSIPASTYAVALIPITASGLQGAQSNPPNVTTTAANNAIQLGFTPDASAAYTLITVGTYKVIADATVTSLLIPALAAVPVQNLSLAANAVLYGAVGVAGSAEQDVPGKPKVAQLAGARWELLYMGLFEMPPVHTPDGQTVPSWVFNVYAKAGAQIANVLDVAALCLIAEDEPHFLAEYRGLNLATQAQWILDDPKDRYISALLKSGGSYIGAARASGELRVAPGNNMFTILAEGAAGVFDKGLAFQASLRYTPLYAWLRGGDVDVPLSDSFNRANALGTLGIADSGQSYTNNAGTFGISTNHFYVNTAPTAFKSFAFANAGQSDGVIRATLLAAGASPAYLVFRFLDANNFYELAATTSGYTLYQYAANVRTTVASSAVHAAANDQIAVTLSGTSCTVVVNGATLINAATIPNNSTSPWMGLGGDVAATEQWDAWSLQSG